jgi:tetraacyldisaccharide 4'-kinase
MIERIWKKVLRRKGLGVWSIPALILRVLSWGFRLGYIIRNKQTVEPFHASVPVISIGNITIGGTGKTPLVEFISRFLERDGIRVGVISSGYGRESQESFVAVGHEVCRMDVAKTGDEVMLLASLLPQTLFSVHSVKAEAARALAQTGKIDVMIVDDGFQHRGLFRDIDIVAFDGAIRRSWWHTFPYGVMREPFDALSRANVVIITRSNFARELVPLRKKIQAVAPKAHHYQAKFSISGVIGRERRWPVKFLEDKSVFLFAGIGNFRSFRKQVESLAANVHHTLEFSDHQRYDENLLVKIRDLANEYDSDIIVTTFKDWVKLGSFDFGREICYLSQSIDLDPGEEKLIAHIQSSLSLRRKSRV